MDALLQVAGIVRLVSGLVFEDKKHSPANQGTRTPDPLQNMTLIVELWM